MKKDTRREFIAKSAAASAGLILGGKTLATSRGNRILGANDKIRMGFIGIGNRGSELLALFMKESACEIAALCDTYKPYQLRDRSKVEPRWIADVGKKVPKMHEKFPNKPTLYDDWRDLLNDKSIDAVVIATPDHWHAAMTIAAIKAGKDVYCEKPLTATIAEGRAMVNAQKASDRVVAVGLNRRGNIVYQTLKKEIHKIGQISIARAARIDDMWPNGIGKMKPEKPPKDFNWDMWLGPRAFRPYQYNIAPYKFRWWSDYSSQMGNWGVHYMDAIRWMMGETAPVAVTAVGDKYILDHDATIPDTMHVTFEFASKKMISFTIDEVTSGLMQPYGELEIRGTKGTVQAGQEGWKMFPTKPGTFQTWDENDIIESQEFSFTPEMLEDGSNAVSTGQLVHNFLECIVSREEPLCPLEEGHRSTSFAHLANISLALKQRLVWDSVNERFTNSDEANQMLNYEYREPWKL